MAENQLLAPFREATAKIVAGLQKDSLAELQTLYAQDEDISFTVLTSKEAMGAKQILLIVSGIPEETGVWSYTLLQLGRLKEASMGAYFEMARKHGCGVIALNPHGNGVEGKSSEYHLQLKTVLSLLSRKPQDRTVTILCFSAGGGMTVEFLNGQADLARSITNMVLIDTTPPPLSRRMISKDVQQLLGRTILFGLEDEQEKISYMAQATASVLGLHPTPVRAKLHGELPNLLIGEVDAALSEARRVTGLGS